MESKQATNGPFRATKLWNDAVSTFHKGMPLGRHWRGLRQYDSCFTAIEAINWLLAELRGNANFGPTVSRENTIKLLRKFLKNEVIIPVRNVKMHPDEFGDNRELFKLNHQSPLKSFKSPVRPPLVPVVVNSPNVPCDEGYSPVVIKTKKQRKELSTPNENTNPQYENVNNKNVDLAKLSPFSNNQRTKEAWRLALFKRMEMICEKLGVTGDGSSPLVEKSYINADWMRTNMMVTKSSHGTLSRTDLKSNELPSWVLSAMKCLANFPNSSESVCNLPNYLGVEQDVFKIVRDFFTTSSVPLIPYELYDAVVRLYIGAEFLDVSFREPSVTCSSSCESLENLMLDISVSVPPDEGIQDTPQARIQTPPPPPSLRLDKLKNYTNFKDSFMYTKQESTPLGNPPIYEEGFRSRDLQNMQLPPNTCFETAFISNSPLTRIVPNSVDDAKKLLRTVVPPPNFHGSLNKLVSITGSTMDDILDSLSSTCSTTSEDKSQKPNLAAKIRDSLRQKKNAKFQKKRANTSSTSLESVPGTPHRKYRRTPARRNASRSITGSLSCQSFELALNEDALKPATSCESNLYHSALSHFEESACSAKVAPFNRKISPQSFRELNRSDQNPGSSTQTSFMSTDCVSVSVNEALPKSISARNLSDGWADRTPFGGVAPYMKEGLLRHYQASPRLLTRAGKEACTEALQLLLLLLEPPRRKKLQLLLKMMSKVSKNDKIQLDTDKTNRALMVSTFSRMILLSERENEYDEPLSIRITSFLMDCCCEIFSSPAQIAVDAYQEEKKMIDLIASGAPVTFCEQVTAETFEEQKLTGSQLFLSELLDQLLVDPKLSHKERRKKLKEFQAHYPLIYQRKFRKQSDPLQENATKTAPKFKTLTNLKAQLSKTKSFRI